MHNFCVFRMPILPLDDHEWALTEIKGEPALLVRKRAYVAAEVARGCHVVARNARAARRGAVHPRPVHEHCVVYRHLPGRELQRVRLCEAFAPELFGGKIHGDRSVGILVHLVWELSACVRTRDDVQPAIFRSRLVYSDPHRARQHWLYRPIRAILVPRHRLAYACGLAEGLHSPQDDVIDAEARRRRVDQLAIRRKLENAQITANAHAVPADATLGSFLYAFLYSSLLVPKVAWRGQH
mmetsp:Transcript_24751/g.57651  ORF Transcript_24751/g.57651 Transcript_24751/m.57651 type:complete len:239 (+) Transcript_24751:166-882(+)